MLVLADASSITRDCSCHAQPTQESHNLKRLIYDGGQRTIEGRGVWVDILVVRKPSRFLHPQDNHARNELGPSSGSAQELHGCSATLLHSAVQLVNDMMGQRLSIFGLAP